MAAESIRIGLAYKTVDVACISVNSRDHAGWIDAMDKSGGGTLLSIKGAELPVLCVEEAVPVPVSVAVGSRDRAIRSDANGICACRTGRIDGGNLAGSGAQEAVGNPVGVNIVSGDGTARVDSDSHSALSYSAWCVKQGDRALGSAHEAAVVAVDVEIGSGDRALRIHADCIAGNLGSGLGIKLGNCAVSRAEEKMKRTVVVVPVNSRHQALVVDSIWIGGIGVRGINVEDSAISKAEEAGVKIVRHGRIIEYTAVSAVGSHDRPRRVDGSAPGESAEAAWA